MPRHHHVNLGVPTGGVQAQIEFLDRVMGYRRMDVGPAMDAMGVVWFEGDDGCQIHLSEDPDHNAPKRAHVAVTCADGELDEVRQRLDAAGIVPRPIDGTGIRTFLVFEDPSGNRWELRSTD